MENSKFRYQRLPQFTKKHLLDIEDKRQAQIHHYKYVNTLNTYKVSVVIANHQKEKSGSYNQTLKRLKLLRYFNNENLIHIPKNIFSSLKNCAKSLKKIDSIEFRNIYTIRHLKNIETAFLIDILPSEMKRNNKLTRALFSLPLFESRTNFENMGQFFTPKTLTPNYSSIKEIIVDVDSKIYRFNLASKKEFQKLKSEFDTFSLHITSDIDVDVRDLSSFLSAKKDAVNVIVPNTGLSLSLLSTLTQDASSLQQIETFNFFQDFDTDKQKDDSPDQIDGFLPGSLDFTLLGKFENLRVLGLGFDCTPFAKNIADVLNSMVLPRSLEAFGLQLHNCDLSVTVEEFILSSSKVSSNESAVALCFESFIHSFSQVENLKTFALELSHPSTDTKLPFELSYQILRRLKGKISVLFLAFDHCCASREAIEINDMMNEIQRLSPEKLSISLPIGSVTSLCEKNVLKEVVQKSKGYLFTNFSKDTVGQIAEMNGNSWYFGTTFGNANLSFPYENFLKSDSIIDTTVNKFNESYVDSITMLPHSLMYFLDSMFKKDQLEMRLAKVSVRKETTSEEQKKKHVLLEGEIRFQNEVRKVDLVLTIDDDKSCDIIDIFHLFGIN